MQLTRVWSYYIILESCRQVWSLYVNKDSNLIEGIQRGATKMIQDIKHLPYAKEIGNFGIVPPHYERVRSDLIQTFKIIYGLIQTFKIIHVYGIDKVDKGLFFFEFDSGDRRGHSSKLFKKRNRLDIRKYTFSRPNRIADKWNSLSQDCINCTTINAYKEHTQKHPELKTIIALLWIESYTGMCLLCHQRHCRWWHR